MITTSQQSFLFRIDRMFALKDNLGTILTGDIISGKVRLEDQVIYTNKYQTPVF